MPHLGVNIDHVATLRQARGGHEPDPIAAAVLVDLGGADGLVVHLREDRRHIQERDLTLLKDIIPTKLNLEMAAEDDIVKIALQVRPHVVTLVPERRQELTTEGGLAVVENQERLKPILETFHDAEIPVSLFIDSDVNQIKAARKLKAQSIELHTGRYANCLHSGTGEDEFNDLVQAARLAHKLGLRVHAGHGLNYRNVTRLREISEIVEYNIGHSIISHAVFVGLERAVREMKALIG